MFAPRHAELVAPAKFLIRDEDLDLRAFATYGRAQQTRNRYVLAGRLGPPSTCTLHSWTTLGAIILSAHPSFSLDEFERVRRGMDGLARGVFPMGRLNTHRSPLDEIQTAFEIAMMA